MLNRSVLRSLAVVAGAVLVGSTTACTGSSSPDVVTAFYPLQFLTERIGGDTVTVVNLTKPGTEPHDLELTTTQVGQVSEAKLIVYLKGFQPAVDEAVAQEGGKRAFDIAEVQPLLDTSAAAHRHEGGHGQGDGHGHAEGAKDPHVWLDPIRLAAIGDRLADRLADVDPDHAAGYAARAAALRADLEQLDREYAEGLATCQRREIVVSHAAFGYLTERYQLEQIAVSGLTPEGEPSPQRLAEVVEEAKAHQATTIFFETLVSPKVAETIAREIGVGTAVLDPIEGLAPGSTDDYFSVMRANLAALRSALGCA